MDKDTAERCAKLALKIGWEIARELPRDPSEAGKRASMVGVATGTAGIIAEAICRDILGLPGVPMEWETPPGERMPQ